MEQKCETCSSRMRYDSNPRSFLGRIWKWHISWCPGWKKYLAALSEDERNSIKEHYK